MWRLLLLIAGRENRRLVAELLGSRYEIAEADPATPPNTRFDLAIVDGPTIRQLHAWTETVRRKAQPVFLPFLLVTQRRDVRLATAELWKSVDDLIAAPIEKAELQARVESLLRARRLSLENAALAVQLQRELARAAQVQADLLPREVPELEGFELAACCVPAREVGGDFYDWQELSAGRLALVLADVMGKGMPAALVMATVRATLRAAAQQSPPAAAVELVRHALEADLERAGSFVTLFHGRLDARQRRLRYVDAGHGHAFVLRSDGRAERLAQSGLPLGFPADRPYVEAELRLAPGDAVVVYSDGLLEALGRDEAEPEALAEGIERRAPAGEIVRQLMAGARLDALPDDLTLLVLRCRED